MGWKEGRFARNEGKRRGLGKAVAERARTIGTTRGEDLGGVGRTPRDISGEQPRRSAKNRADNKDTTDTKGCAGDARQHRCIC